MLPPGWPLLGGGGGLTYGNTKLVVQNCGRTRGVQVTVGDVGRIGGLLYTVLRNEDF